MMHYEDVKRIRENPTAEIDTCDIKELQRLISEAIEKQIPKKPITDKYYCKCSNGHNIPVICKNGKMKYCPMCGQAIDWSEVE